MSIADASKVDISNTVDSVQMVKNVIMTAIAFFMDPSEMRRPNNVTLFLFFTVASAQQINTAIVTVLMPPAVPTGEPPIIISIMETTAEAFVRFSCGTEAKPAVLVVTDWKRDTCILSNSGMFLTVKGFEYSKMNIRAAPTKIRIRVTAIAILLCRVRCLNIFLLFLLFVLITQITSHQTM